MHLVQDVVDLIVDQLSQPTDYETIRHLRVASLVSTVWVNRSQHHLFSALGFYDSGEIKKWCSRIKPDPVGVSRHVRTLTVGFSAALTSPLLVSDIETALPHLASFKLQELVLHHPDLENTSLGVLAPIFSSSAVTLKRLQYTHSEPDIHETWKDISALAHSLPNLTYITLSGYRDDPSQIQIRLSADGGLPFRELQIIHAIPHSLPFLESCGPHLQVLDLYAFQMCEPREDDHQAFRTLLETCHTLEVLSFSLYPGTARFLGSVPSSSISFIRVHNPLGFGDAPMTYSDSWPWESFEQFEKHCSYTSDDDLAEFAHLGVSIRKMAQRFSICHPGSKTRVQATLDLWESEIRAVENGETPLYKSRLEEELGNYVDLELILIPNTEYHPGPKLKSGTDA